MRTYAPGARYKTRDQDGLTRAHRAVLNVLKKHANDRGTVCMTNGELAHKAAVSARSVQAATAHLAAAGFLLKIERRRTATYSEPNIYRLAGRQKFVPQGRKKRMQKSRRDESILQTPCPTSSATDERCNPVLRETDRRASGRREPMYRAPKAPALSAYDRERLVNGLRRLGIKLGDASSLTDGQVLDRIDQLRQKRIGAFKATAWGYRATVHGVQAWFAVIETVAMMDGRIPRDDGEIRDPAAYLGGILWKDEPDPRKTVTDWLEIAERLEREARADEVRQAYKAKQAGNDALFAKVVELTGRVIGPDKAESWLKPAWIAAVAGERVTVAFPTRFLKEWAWSHYRQPITRAFAEVRGEATEVVFTVRSVKNV